MTRYTRLTIEGQRVDIDADGRCGVIEGGEWVLTIGTARRHPDAPSRWQASPADAYLRETPSPTRHLTRRAAILALLNQTSWAPRRPRREGA